MDIDGQSSNAYAPTTTPSSSLNGTPAPSVYSYSSSRDGRALLRELGGRTLNAQNELYLLPADEYEHLRLDKQHFVHLMSVGGLYIGVQEVEEALKNDGSPRTILDLGCGGGNWAIAMAEEFDHAEVIGVDLAPSTIRPPPFNCRFEFDDFTLGLEHYYGKFDVVHMRSTANGVKDFKALVDECAKCLKHDGVLIIIEGNFEIMNELRQPQEIAFGEGGPGQSWTARMCFEAYNAMKLRGSAVDAGIMLERWMNECSDLVDVKFDTKWIPIGPWEQGISPEDTQNKITIGTLMRQNIKEFAKSLIPVFIANGYAPELIDRFVQGTNQELDDLSVHIYLRYHHCWARRITYPEDDEMDNDVDIREGQVDGAVGVVPPEPGGSMGTWSDSRSTRSTSRLSTPPPPGPRAVRINWKTDPVTGEKYPDTQSLAGSMHSMGTASMSISSGA